MQTDSGVLRLAQSPEHGGSMAKHEGVKPGEKAPASGQYEERGPRGGKTGHEVTISRGERMPPTKGPGGSFDLVDPSKNKSGRQ